MENFLNELNESQRQAVIYNEGPSMIIAGAGSGKTRVLTYKIAYLINQGIPANTILSLTFTNKAAAEMKSRIAKVVGWTTARQIWMGTFHSIFSRILRIESQYIGFKPDFTIYDSTDSKNLIKTIIKEMQLDDKLYKPATVQSQISNAKNHLITPSMYAVSKELLMYDQKNNRPHILDIYKKYWVRCRQAGAMDFDDLLLYTNILFRDFPEVLQKYQNYFQYILVDEYQDTNKAQHLIVELLGKVHNKICVVGDDAQSIYSFRGANIANILNFKTSIKGTKVFKLEQNYRSTQTIVQAANSLIKKNSQQIKKDIFSENSKGEKISLYSSYSDFDEAFLISNKISEMRLAGHYDFSDFAILYRTNAQSRVLEEALRKRNIPYKIYGGLSFYQRKEIKDVIAYFRLSINPADEEAFKRVINYPARGIGDTTLKKIGLAASDSSISFFDAICAPLEYGLNLNSGTLKKIEGFKDIILDFVNLNNSKNAYEMADTIIRRSGIMHDLNVDNTVEATSRKQNVEALLAGIYDFVQSKIEEGSTETSMVDFLSDIALASDVEQEVDESERDKVTLMTIHASKGLEFKNVFIAGLEEDLFPSSMAKETINGLEEERRLFYVALTRAEENCVLTYAGTRFKNGQSQPCSSSRFLKDIDPKYLDISPGVRLSQSVETIGRSFSDSNKFASSYQKEDYYPSEKLRNNDNNRNSGYNSFDRGYEDEYIPKKVERKEVYLGAKKLKKVNQTPSSASHTSIQSSTVTSGSELIIGSVIRHDRFGIGKVSQLSGDGENKKATVEFENVGSKQLLLKFAKFEIIG